MPATRYYSFDLTLGTNQVERLRKPPRDPAQLRVAHAGQWTDDNRKLDGSFERMEKFASEIATQSKRMPKTVLATTTPLNDPYFARSMSLVGTAIEALDTPDHMITKAHMDLIISWPKMESATDSYTVLQLSQEAVAKFISNPRMESFRPAWAVYTPETDESSRYLFGDVHVMKDGVPGYAGSPFRNGMPEGFHRLYPWRDYEAQPVRLHPAVVGSTQGLRHKLHLMGMSVYGEEGLDEYQMISVAYGASQLLGDERKIRGPDGLDYWRPVGWLHEERTGMPIIPWMGLSDPFMKTQPWHFDEGLSEARVAKLWSVYYSIALEDHNPGRPDAHVSPETILMLYGNPVVSEEASAQGRYVDSKELRLCQFDYNSDNMWINWTNPKSKLREFVMAITPEKWEMKDRWEFDIVAVSATWECIQFMKKYYDLNYEHSKKLKMDSPINKGGVQEVDDKQAEKIRKEKEKRDRQQQQQASASAGPTSGGAPSGDQQSGKGGAPSSGQPPTFGYNKYDSDNGKWDAKPASGAKGPDDWGRAADGSDSQQQPQRQQGGWNTGDGYRRSTWDDGWKGSSGDGGRNAGGDGKSNDWQSGGGYDSGGSYGRSDGGYQSAPSYGGYDAGKDKGGYGGKDGGSKGKEKGGSKGSSKDDGKGYGKGDGKSAQPDRSTWANNADRRDPNAGYVTKYDWYQTASYGEQRAEEARQYRTGLISEKRPLLVTELNKNHCLAGKTLWGEAPVPALRVFTTLSMNITGGFGTRNVQKTKNEQVKLATINGYACLNDDMETKVGQFLIASSCKPVPERDDRSTMLQNEVLTLKQHQQVQAMFVTNANNAIFVDDLPRLCGANNLDQQIGTDVLRRAHAVATAKTIPRWKPVNVPYRWDWRPAWTPEQGLAVKESEPYRVLTLPYQFVNEEGMPYIEKIEAPVFLHDGLMTIHVVGKSGGMGIPMATRTEKGAVFAGYHMRAMPPQMRGFESYPTEPSYGLPGNDLLVGSMWRALDGNPAFESVTRNSGHPGPECGAFCPRGSSRMPSIRSDMDADKQVVLPCVLAHVVSSFLGPLNTARKDDRNSAAAGANQRHFTADGEIPRGTFSQVNTPNLSGRLGWLAMAGHSGKLPGLEEGQHPTILLHQDTLMRDGGEPFDGYQDPGDLMPVVAHPAHGGGNSNETAVESSLGFVFPNDERQNQAEHNQHCLVAARVQGMFRSQSRGGMPSLWKQVMNSVEVRASEAYSSRGTFEMHVHPSIKDPNLRFMIEDCLWNNVGTDVDEFKDHPDNELSLEEQAAAARGEKLRTTDAEVVTPPYRKKDAKTLVLAYVKKYGHVRSKDVPMPQWPVPESPFLAQGFGDIAIPYFYSEIRQQIKKRTPQEQGEIVNPARVAATAIIRSPGTVSGIWTWHVPSAAAFLHEFREIPLLMHLTTGMTQGLATAATILYIGATIDFLVAKTGPGPIDRKTAEAKRVWALLRSHPYALTGIVAANHLAADVQVAKENLRPEFGDRMTPLVKAALHNTDEAVQLLMMLMPENRNARQDRLRPDDPFLQEPETWTTNEQTEEQLSAFGLGLMDVHVGQAFSEVGAAPTRCCDMPGAVLRGLKERVLCNTFSYVEREEIITKLCEPFLDDVIRFAHHCLSHKRLKNIEMYLHPTDHNPYQADIAQVWYTERLGISVFVGVAPEPVAPIHTALSQTLRLSEWDQPMLIGIDGGGVMRSTVSDTNLLRTLSRYLSTPQKKIQLCSVEELLNAVAGTKDQQQRRGFHSSFA